MSKEKERIIGLDKTDGGGHHGGERYIGKEKIKGRKGRRD